MTTSQTSINNGLQINYRANGYDLNRNSEKKVFTHAVIFKNLASSFTDGFGADFHISLKLAEANAKKINKYSHIQVIEIVEVTKVGA